MAQQIDPALKEKLLSVVFRPTVTMWNRLEGRPRQEAFDRSLRAEVRDPLWMLTRQWQVGEFKGEDAGSAAKVRVQLDATRLDRFAVKSPEGEQGGSEFQPAVPTISRHRWKCRSSASRSGSLPRQLATSTFHFVPRWGATGFGCCARAETNC